MVSLHLVAILKYPSLHFDLRRFCFGNYSGNNTIEDCYFYHIDYTATDLNGLMTTIQMGGSNNVFKNNTMHKLGASATLNLAMKPS